MTWGKPSGSTGRQFAQRWMNSSGAGWSAGSRAAAPSAPNATNTASARISPLHLHKLCARQGPTPGPAMPSRRSGPQPRPNGTSWAWPRGANVTVLDRVRFIDGMPVSTAVSVLPSALVPRLASVLPEDGSLDEVLRRHYGYSPHRQWSQSRLASPPAGIAATLGLRGRLPRSCCAG